MLLFISAIPPPSDLLAVKGWEVYYFDLYWNQEGPIDEFVVYWKTDHGPEYNMSTGSSETSYRLSDRRITPATWYYISLQAVAGEETSDRSDTISAASSQFIKHNYHPTSCLFKQILVN